MEYRAFVHRVYVRGNQYSFCQFQKISVFWQQKIRFSVCSLLLCLVQCEWLQSFFSMPFLSSSVKFGSCWVRSMEFYVSKQRPLLHFEQLAKLNLFSFSGAYFIIVYEPSIFPSIVFLNCLLTRRKNSKLPFVLKVSWEKSARSAHRKKEVQACFFAWLLTHSFLFRGFVIVWLHGKILWEILRLRWTRRRAPKNIISFSCQYSIYLRIS